VAKARGFPAKPQQFEVFFTGLSGLFRIGTQVGTRPGGYFASNQPAAKPTTRATPMNVYARVFFIAFDVA